MSVCWVDFVSIDTFFLEGYISCFCSGRTLVLKVYRATQNLNGLEFTHSAASGVQ